MSSLHSFYQNFFTELSHKQRGKIIEPISIAVLVIKFNSSVFSVTRHRSTGIDKMLSILLMSDKAMALFTLPL